MDSAVAPPNAGTFGVKSMVNACSSLCDVLPACVVSLNSRMTFGMEKAICFTLLALLSAEKCWRRDGGFCGTSTQGANRGVGSVPLRQNGSSDTVSHLNALE